MSTSPSLSRLILYVHNLPKVSAFYCTYFGFHEESIADQDMILLTSPAGGCAITLLKASKGHKTGGQSQVKLVFEIKDVEAFKQESVERGLRFGVTHHGEGYAFANVRDPAKNLVQISSRH